MPVRTLREPATEQEDNKGEQQQEQEQQDEQREEQGQQEGQEEQGDIPGDDLEEPQEESMADVELTERSIPPAPPQADNEGITEHKIENEMQEEEEEEENGMQEEKEQQREKEDKEEKEQDQTKSEPAPTGDVATTPVADGSDAAQHRLTPHDVVLDDTTGVIKANKLLTDLIAVHHQLNNKDKGLAQHLVNVMKFGLGVQAPDARPPPQGNFVRRGTDGSISVISDEEAVDYVQKCIDYEFTKPLQDTFEGLGEDLGAVDQDKDGKKSTKKLHDLFSPGAHDLKLLSRDNGTIQGELALEFAKSKGNTRFYMLVDQQVANDAPTFTDARVKTALTALRRFNDSSTFPKIFVESDRKWARVTKIEAAEYVVNCVAERAQEFAPLSSPSQPPGLGPSVPMTNTVLQSLIPDVGIAADISNFLDFSKPSNTPVDEPTEYDVLFGRGGMTNNHPGNRRFRDIISLHRPDYVRAIKIEKPNVARRIVAAIRGGTPPGRFLKRNPKDLKWYDVGNRHATEKTSQALREKTQAEKKFPSENNVKKRLLDQAIYEARKTRARLSKEQETRPISNGCLDPNTFQLLVPPQYMQMAGLSTGYSASSSSPKAKESKKDNTPKNTDKGEKPELHEEKADTELTESTLPEGENAVEAGIIDSDGNIIVTENDILCGRGGLTNHHKGNKRFRDIVALHRADYVRAPKVHKPAVARMIVKAIRTGDPPGRFLKKDERSGKWFDIGDKKAAEKASQALREKTPEERNRLRSQAANVLPVSMFQNPMFTLQSAPSQAAVAAAVAAAKASAAAAAKRHERQTEAATKESADAEVKEQLGQKAEKDENEEKPPVEPPVDMEIDADIVAEVVAASPEEEEEEGTVTAEESVVV